MSALPPNVPSRLRHLPKPLRETAAKLIRRSGWTPRPRYLYKADGLATVHYSPFLEDREFASLYEEMAAEWFVDFSADVRWRMWLLTRLAREAASLEGNFAEFGVYRAGCAFMVLSLTPSEPRRTMYLFDTFAGIPDTHLAEDERERGLAGRFPDTSVEYVEGRLERFRGRFEICTGDVFDTVPETETGPLAFVHIDMNTGAPTRHVLAYAYERLVRGGTVVFDDYGYGNEDTIEERTVIDKFLAERPEEAIALPTGQGYFRKRWRS
jgi:O-methyltransferase